MYADPAGGERFVLPQAYAWDSAGVPAGAPVRELLTPAEGVAVVALTADVTASTPAGSTAVIGSPEGLLADPGTVFPVVIDPSYSMAQTHALRVTQTFHKYDSDIGSRGKIGYNGWTSPFYKSRMYYQFKWPTNTNGTIMNPKQLTKATFSYKQTYSPQHSCTDTSFGPSVRVQPSTVLSGDVSWANQPSLHTNSLAVTNDYAVGQACGTYTQKWNVTEMIRKERVDYATRTTVTLRISSSDESDRNGWREYANSSTSPDLVVDYEPEPLTPTSFAISSKVSSAPLVTNTAAPTIAVTARLATGYKCRASTACVQADFTVKNKTTGTVIVSGKKSGAVWHDTPVQPGIALPAMPNGVYTATVRTYNLDTKLYSKTAATWDFRVDLPPAAPTWSWVIPDDWTDTEELPAGRVLQLQVTPRAADTDVTAFCAQVEQDGQVTTSCKPRSEGPLTVGPLTGPAQVRVAAKDSYTVGAYQADSPQQRTFRY